MDSRIYVSSTLFQVKTTKWEKMKERMMIEMIEKIKRICMTNPKFHFSYPVVSICQRRTLPIEMKYSWRQSQRWTWKCGSQKYNIIYILMNRRIMAVVII